MKPTAISDLIALTMDKPEIQDFDTVVRLHWRRVFRFVLASLRDQDAAETLTQDCFMKAFKGWERFRGDSSVNTWLMQIAVNLVRDFSRNRRLQFWRKARSAAIDASDISGWLPDKDLSPEAKALVKEQLSAVWKVTSELSEKQKTVFLLRFVEDLDIREIGSITGLSEGAVKVHLFRAVHAVRERMGRS